MMDEEEEHDDDGMRSTVEVLPFDRNNVSKIDIVASKIRTYNNKHPGNIFYVQLVQEKLKTVKYDVPSEYTRVAKEIVDTLCVERGGRFLKLKDGEKDHTTCTVMKTKEAVGKVAHALRTAQKKREVELPDAPVGFPTGCKPGGKTKKLLQTPRKQRKQKEQQQVSIKGMDNKPDPDPTPAPSSKRKPKKQKPITNSAEKATKKRGRPPLSSSAVPSLSAFPSSEEMVLTKRAKPTCHYRNDSDVLLYEAQAGEKMPIDPYTLKLISLVCNQHNYGVDDAFKILDAPIEDCTLENEPDKNRLMRLQMRHRFASAAATGLSPLDFSIKLLNLWGGKLVEVVQTEDGDGGTSLTQPATSSSRNENSNGGLNDEVEYDLLTPNGVAFVPPPASPPPATFQELEKEADMMMMDPHSTTLDVHITMPQQDYHNQQQDLLLFQTEASSTTRLDTDETMFLGTSNNLDGDILPPPPPMEADHAGVCDDDAGVELHHPVDLELEERPVSELSVSEKAPSPKFNHPISSYAHMVQNPKSVAVIPKTFKWKNYPDMEQFLIDNRDDYMHHSSMNYTKDQKEYNNRLTHRLLEHAAQHDMLFDEHAFKSFKDIRDRIRCYYKSYVQSMRKRGKKKKAGPEDNEEETYEDIEDSEGEVSEASNPEDG